MDAGDLPPLLAALVSVWNAQVLAHPWFVALLSIAMLFWLINRI